MNKIVENIILNLLFYLSNRKQTTFFQGFFNFYTNIYLFFNINHNIFVSNGDILSQIEYTLSL